MATTKKSKKTNKNKKISKSGKNSNSLNLFSKIMLTLLTIAVIVSAIFLVIGNFKTNDKTKDESTTEVVVKKDNKETSKQHVEIEDKDVKVATPKESKKENEIGTETKKSKVLKGSWLSSEQGASLTLDEYGYRIDFFGVDASKPITGEYYFENNLIVFNTDGDVCGNTEGKYRITFYKNNFSLIAKDDDCTKRRNILEADWEEIEL